MCNIAGYIGERDAAPILIDMIREQEGLNGGFYTGIATLHEGKIYYRKVVGDLDELLRRTDAASLPGKIGIIHSRTPGDLGDEWAHPFVCERDGEVFTAQVYNGSLGFFKDLNPKRAALAAELLSEGYKMRSFVPESNGKNLTLNDGSRVHISDLMCQLVSKNILGGEPAHRAMELSYCEIPAEIVGLMLSVTEPDAIAFARMNMPMFVSYGDDGAYLASAPQAFPDGLSDPHLFPVFSSGYIKKDGFSCAPFKKAPSTVAPITESVRHRAYEKIYSALLEEKQTLSSLAKLANTCFDDADCKQSATLAYSILYDLKKRGLLKVKKDTKPGVFDGLTAPVYYLWVKQ